MSALVAATLFTGCSADAVGDGAAGGPEPLVCHKVGCQSAVHFVVHLPTALSFAEVTVCRGAACATVQLGFEDWVSERVGDARLEVQRADPKTLHASYEIPDRGIDGERFEVRVATHDGTPVLRLDRRIRYGERWFPNGRACDEPHDYWCRSAVVHVWPTSPSGLLCTGEALQSGADIVLATSIPAESMSRAFVEVCRNALCSYERLDAMPCYPGWRWFGRELPVAFSWSCRDGVFDEIGFVATGDPAELADGDRYRATILSWSNEKLVHVDRTVDYVERWPNGPECDPYPLKTATIEAR